MRSRGNGRRFSASFAGRVRAGATPMRSGSAALSIRHFAGTGRFGSWGESIDVVLRAAQASRDPHAEAWALHQRGTRAVSVDESPAGRADLEEALRLRQALGDHRGAAVTQHNLEVLRTPPWYAKLGWGPLTILAIAVVLIAAAAGGALAYREFTGDDEATPTTTTEPTTTESNTTVLVTVPGVVGDPVRAARAELEELGLEVRVTRTPSDEEPAGIVLEQDPEEGEEVEEGSRVALIVSSGPEQVEVPDVVGDPVEVATKELEGFEVTETEAPSAQFDAGIVAAQNPDGGTLVDPGSDVEITVSTGGPPDLDVGITDFSSCQSLEPTCTTIHFVVRTVNGVPLPGAIPIRIVSRLVESDPVEVTDELEPENDGATEESFTQEIECDPKGCLLTVEVDPERTLDDPDYANNTATYPDVE
jgi:PASTA domain